MIVSFYKDSSSYVDALVNLNTQDNSQLIEVQTTEKFNHSIALGQTRNCYLLPQALIP